jgi:hypothetical protein
MLGPIVAFVFIQPIVVIPLVLEHEFLKGRFGVGDLVDFRAHPASLVTCLDDFELAVGLIGCNDSLRRLVFWLRFAFFEAAVHIL